MDDLRTSHRFLRKSGFTLIEITIAMAIFAIVTGSLLGNFFTSISKGRDSRRKQDLELIGKSLDLYYNDHRAYPITVFPTPPASFNDGTTTYMQTIPVDPKSNLRYTYIHDASPPGSAGDGYKLYACLENSNDPKYHKGGYAGTNCGSACKCVDNSGGSCGTLCTYGIASFNDTP